MWRSILLLSLAFGLTGCAGGISVARESPARTGLHLYAAPPFALGEDQRTVHPVVGYSSIDGASFLALGGQIRQGVDDQPFWYGGEASYLRIEGLNGFSIGGLAGYDLPLEMAWPVAAYAYLGYLDAYNTGIFARLGIEVTPPELMEMLENF